MFYWRYPELGSGSLYGRCETVSGGNEEVPAYAGMTGKKQKKESKMKKIIMSLVCLLVASGAFAAGENIATSKAYVDNAVAQKQEKIPANDGAAQVLTNTGTPGEIGTKNIYNSTGTYSEQTDSLITAGDFNTAVQNAIDTEFECIAWRDPNDHNSDCMLVQIRGVTDSPSGKNLFDVNNAKIILKSLPEPTVDKTSDGLTVTYQGTFSDASHAYAFVMVELGNINKFLGKTLVMSANKNCVNGGTPAYSIAMCNDDCTIRSGTGRSIDIPQQPDAGLTKVAFRLYATAGGTGTNPACTYTNIQVEEGSNVTSYEPYQNLYIPQNQ